MTFLIAPAAAEDHETHVTVLGGVVEAYVETLDNSYDPYLPPGWTLTGVRGNLTSNAAPIDGSYMLLCVAAAATVVGFQCYPKATIEAADHSMSIGPGSSCGAGQGPSAAASLCAFAVDVNGQGIVAGAGGFCWFPPSTSYEVLCWAPIVVVRAPDGSVYGTSVWSYQTETQTCSDIWAAVGTWESHFVCADNAVVTVDDTICVFARAWIDGQEYEVPPSCVEP